MAQKIKLSELVSEIQNAIESRFEGEVFWVTAEITDVRPNPQKQWCFLKFIEKDGQTITTCIEGVFWSNSFFQIDKFEKLTKTKFTNGLEITCKVRVRFNMRYGLKLDVLEIDPSHILGKLELEKQQTLERLVKENPTAIRFIDGQYITKNNRLELPVVFQKIALITATNSDGQRDLKKELEHNKYGYAFSVTEYLTQMQGDNSSKLIFQQLKMIESEKEKFDVVAIVRGGGSQTDFKPFDDYELSKCVATFPIPILTGIGHDSNVSIIDLMARQHKTPTKVGAYIIDHNMSFEASMEELKERFFQAVEDLIENAKDSLKELKRVVKSSSPTTILNRGFAIVTSNAKIVTDPKSIKTNSQLQTLLKNETIHSTVIKKTKNENRFDI